MIDDYSLERDLAAIGRALKYDMPDASIFYCGRALENTASRAISALNLEPGAQLFANLDCLDQLAFVPRSVLSLAHSLRRVSNDARHMLRTLSRNDAEFAILSLSEWLSWYSADYVYGPKDGRADIAGATLLSSAAETSELLRLVRVDDQDITQELIGRSGQHVLKVPTLAALLVEALISAGKIDEAQEILTSALGHSPRDLRLTQLMALSYNRAGRPQDAVVLLKSLHPRFSEDQETLGITAGALKACWEAGQKPDDALEQALHHYSRGWDFSLERNFYLGVNAAAVRLWLKHSDSKELAMRIVSRLSERNAKLTKLGIDLAAHRGYYDTVTEAEARLLAGDQQTARALYARAFSRFSARGGDIRGSKRQANRSIALLGGEPLA